MLVAGAAVVWRRTAAWAAAALTAYYTLVVVLLMDGRTVLRHHNEFIAWSLPQAGPYNPTPVVYGEHLYVEDRAADGHSAVAVWYTPWTGTRYVWNPHGAFGPRADGNLSLAEGTGISYMVCLGEYGSRTVLWNTCSNPVADRA